MRGVVSGQWSLNAVNCSIQVVSNTGLTVSLFCSLITKYPLPKRQILDASKLKGLADNNFKFDENGRKLPKWEKNTVGKGEIAHYERFLHFPQCFQKACTADT